MRSSPRGTTMRKARFSEEQITYALKQVESGKPVGEVCRQIGVSEQSFYRWRRKYEGMGVAELRRLRQLEEENRKLKKIVADLTLDKHILQVSRGLQNSPTVGIENSPTPSGYWVCSSGRIRPALSFSLSRYELPRMLMVIAW